MPETRSLWRRSWEVTPGRFEVFPLRAFFDPASSEGQNLTDEERVEWLQRVFAQKELQGPKWKKIAVFHEMLLEFNEEMRRRGYGPHEAPKEALEALLSLVAHLVPGEPG